MAILQIYTFGMIERHIRIVNMSNARKTRFSSPERQG